MADSTTLGASQTPESTSTTSVERNIKKRTYQMTDLERVAIRKRYREHPGKQADLITWFYNTTGHLINQSQISKILSERYASLDDLTLKKTALESKRHYDGKWPDLDLALFEWHQRIQRTEATITGEILLAKAKEIWEQLPQYKDEVPPQWSNGWLAGWKKRFGVKQYKRYGEARSADVNNPENIKQMEDLRRLCSEYPNSDIFNMDETGLFWKLSPDRTLATQATSGGKKSKDRITVALTTNADGSEKLDPWIIGKSKKPRCFKGIGNLKLLRVQYSHNNSKWMTGEICKKFLQWFDDKMGGRKVLLLMDNFLGHSVGLELCGGNEGLKNTRVEWLPPNTTSHWQPLDQGIIAAYKLQYRRRWVKYMLRQLEAGKNPNTTVNLLRRFNGHGLLGMMTSKLLQFKIASGSRHLLRNLKKHHNIPSLLSLTTYGLIGKI
jgi:DDE superfamily endonuclease/Tc5 transposase DNA-binding domain/Fission yeast centromere protein N-terminal domain